MFSYQVLPTARVHTMHAAAAAARLSVNLAVHCHRMVPLVFEKLSSADFTHLQDHFEKLQAQVDGKARLYSTSLLSMLCTSFPCS